MARAGYRIFDAAPRQKCVTERIICEVVGRAGVNLRHRDFQSAPGGQTMSRHRRTSLTIKRIADGSVFNLSVRGAWSPMVSAKSLHGRVSRADSEASS